MELMFEVAGGIILASIVPYILATIVAALQELNAVFHGLWLALKSLLAMGAVFLVAGFLYGIVGFIPKDDLKLDAMVLIGFVFIAAILYTNHKWGQKKC